MCLAIPGRILSVSGDEPLMRVARVDFGGIVKEINLALVPEAGVGDYVVVHVGYALTRIDPKEADRTLALLAEADASRPAVP
jgi:hydrogenase expression/formation protein HypC